MKRLWRLLLIRLGIKRITPRRNERLPNVSNLRHVEAIADTGGGWYRPKYKQQNPAVDPKEPWGDESNSSGENHGWSNCTMASGAMAIDFATLGELNDKWGGNMRHRQGDLDGGTDLYDLQDAFRYYDVSLSIRSGDGWESLKDDRDSGRFIVAQGTGNVPGSESFDGGHACVISPETRSSDGYWLFGDPLADGWQWIKPSHIKSWMQAWNANMSFAVTEAHKPATEPEPPEPPEPTPPEPPKPNPPPYQEPKTAERYYWDESEWVGHPSWTVI